MVCVLSLRAWALSPPPSGAEPAAAGSAPTPAQLYDNADLVVYGPIVRLDLDASAAESSYTAIIHPAQSWKGASRDPITMTGSLYRLGWCGNEIPRSPFEFYSNFLVFLKKRPEGNTHQVIFSEAVNLPFHLPVLNPWADAANRRISIDQKKTMECLEFLERAAGNPVEADRLAGLLAIEAAALKKEAEAQAALQAWRNDIHTEFEHAMQEKQPARRQSFLQKLERILDEKNDPEMIDTQRKITAELSVISTILENGLSTMP